MRYWIGEYDYGDAIVCEAPSIDAALDEQERYVRDVYSRLLEDVDEGEVNVPIPTTVTIFAAPMEPGDEHLMVLPVDVSRVRERDSVLTRQVAITASTAGREE